MHLLPLYHCLTLGGTLSIMDQGPSYQILESGGGKEDMPPEAIPR